MEEMKMATIVHAMTKYANGMGQPAVEPKHIVKLPDNGYSVPVSPEVYAARVGDLVIVARLWPHGRINFNHV